MPSTTNRVRERRIQSSVHHLPLYTDWEIEKFPSRMWDVNGSWSFRRTRAQRPEQRVPVMFSSSLRQHGDRHGDRHGTFSGDISMSIMETDSYIGSFLRR